MIKCSGLDFRCHMRLTDACESAHSWDTLARIDKCLALTIEAEILSGTEKKMI